MGCVELISSQKGGKPHGYQGKIEEYIGVDLPGAQVNQLIEGIKARIKLDQVGDVQGGLGKLFGK